MAERSQLLIRFGYVGDRFHGLQPQRDVPTAGAALRARVEEAAGVRARGLSFAARTDAGVHALQNLATCFFRGDEVGDPAALAAALTRPRDDGLLWVRAEPVPRNVHARGSSQGKRYRYLVDAGWPAEEIGPELRAGPAVRQGGYDPRFGRFSWRIAPPLDVERMRGGACALVGEHDFSAFRAAGCTASTPVKNLVRLSVRGPYPLGPGHRVILELAGDAFLRKMVRLIVGLLVEVGTGLRTPDDVERVLAERTRSPRALLAPARGLTLLQVGCTWPPDGSALVPELARLEPGGPLLVE